MSFFWLLYREYCDSISVENWIIDLKRKDKHTIIKVIGNSSDINVNTELEYLNLLYSKYNIKDYGFDIFFVKEVISIKCNYDSMYLFISNRL